MNEGKLSEGLLDSLSDDAKGIAGAWFGMMRPGGSSELVFQMVENKPTARAQAALGELQAAGIIRKEPYNRFGAVRYVPVVECRPYLQWLWNNQDRPELKFPLTEAISNKANGNG